MIHEMLGFYLSMLETERERKRMADVYDAYQMTCLFVAKSVIRDDDGLAEDAVHNTFLALISRKELLDLPDDRLKALVLAIVKRRAIDLLRKKTRDKTEPLDDIESMPSPAESVEVLMSKSVDFERLADKLSCMEETHRTILQLKYYAELSNTKIGEYLGITNRQVEVQLYRAKQKLKKSFFNGNDEGVAQDV